MLATSALTASGMAARSSGFDPACGGACAADLQTRWHTVTAEASQPHASSGSSGSPNTPAAAQRTATITPTAGSAAAHGAAAAAADAAAADAATTAGDSLAPPPPAPHHDPAALQRRVHSFLVCVSASPLVQSALLSLEVEEGGHPPAAGAPDASAAAAGCLEWTLAQLLALHLRAGYERGELALPAQHSTAPPAAARASRPLPAVGARTPLPTRHWSVSAYPPTHTPCRPPALHPAASESSLLAALWTLESLHSAWRSSATAVLSSYVRLLAAFSPEVGGRTLPPGLRSRCGIAGVRNECCRYGRCSPPGLALLRYCRMGPSVLP